MSIDSAVTARLARDIRALRAGDTRGIETEPWVLVSVVAYLRAIPESGVALRSVPSGILAHADAPRADVDRLLAAWVPDIPRTFPASSDARETLLRNHASLLFSSNVIRLIETDDDELTAVVDPAFRSEVGEIDDLSLPDHILADLSPAAHSADTYLAATIAPSTDPSPHIAFAASAWPTQITAALHALFTGPASDSLIGAVLGMCRALELRGMEERAVTVIRGLDLTTDNPYATVQAAEYLLWAGSHVDEAADAVRRCAAATRISGFRGNPQRDAYARLALTYRGVFTADEALSFLHDAQHDSSANRNGVAKMLAWIGRPWALRELRPAVDDDRDPLQIVRAAERSLRGDRRPSDSPRPHDDEEWTARQWEANDDRLLDAGIEHDRPVLERITDLSDPRA
ncbi:MAG: hypothetical protein IJG47_14570 [Microbacterium sp.]|nr:hypothetical protein [Microbacterium sp.]